MTSSFPDRSVVPLGRASASALAWQFKGEIRVSVVAKATFAFGDEGPARRADALPILHADAHHAKNPMRSLGAASDIVPYRRRADVLFTGHAHAPSGGKVESINARIGVASGARVLLDKALNVRKKGGFQRVALLYEHTVGGPGHPENPFGEDEGSDDLTVFDLADPTRAAGFGPLAPLMPARRRLLGGAPAPRLGAGVTVIPDTFDFDYFQAAPADQQIGFLRGDEWLLLENLHPARPTLRMYLPGARGLARIHGLSQHGIPEGRPLAMSADMLHIHGEEERISITWRGTFAVAGDQALAALRIVTGVEQPDEALTWPEASEIEALAGATPPLGPTPLPLSAGAASTLELSDADILAVSSSSREQLATLAIPEMNKAPSIEVSFAGTGGETLPIASSAAPQGGAKPLPFRAASIGEQLAGSQARSAAPIAQKPRRSGADETLPIASEVSKAPWPDALPFAPVGAKAPVAEPPSAREPVDPPREPLPPAPAPPPPPVAEPAQEGPPPPIAAREEQKRGSVWGGAEIAALAPDTAPSPAPPRAPEKRLPPKVDVRNKLYGTKKA